MLLVSCTPLRSPAAPTEQETTTFKASLRAKFGFVRKKKKAAKAAALSSTDFKSGRVRLELFCRVLVGGDARAHVIRFAIELPLILLGQVAVVLRHIALFVVLQALLTAFEMSGLTRSQLTVLDAVRDAILLVGLATIYLIHARMSGIDLVRACARCCLSLSRS
jgi:hypothetical protein